MIETREGHLYGITPADAAAFQRALAESTPATFPPAGKPGQSLLGLLLPLLLAALSIGLSIAALGYVARFPRALRYQLGPDGLTIQTGWRPVRVPYSELRAVEVAAPKGSPLRVMGTHTEGVLWGRFAWKAAGPKLSLYATETKPLVLLRLTGERTIGITPLESERFVEALRQRIG